MSQTHTTSQDSGKKNSGNNPATLAQESVEPKDESKIKKTAKSAAQEAKASAHAASETIMNKAETAKSKAQEFGKIAAKNATVAKAKAQEFSKAAMDAVKKVDTTKAKQKSLAAARDALDLISGKRESPMLKFLVIGLRIIGISIFLLAVLNMWYFDAMARSLGWLETAATGFAVGFVVFGLAELVNLFIKIESHLRTLAKK